ncbi:MAG: CPBP family intramembrane metalloprotease [Spirochaetales bacterium]|nr:CPBP family intramembrane metalloprotease [Spirochaetales bacterium]
MGKNNRPGTGAFPFTTVKHLFFFIGVLAVSLFVIPLVPNPGMKLAFLTIPVSAAIFLYFDNFRIFVPTLFFTVYAAASLLTLPVLERFGIHIPQIDFLLPIAVYLVIVCCNRRFRKEIDWLTWGRPDKTTWLLIVLFTLASVAGLVVWALIFRQTLTEFSKFIPEAPLFLIIIYGLTFPVFNAFFEEFIARAVMFDGFSRIFASIVPAVLFQAIVFALWHYRGFPGGVSGVVMVFLWSLFLGYVRYRSKGMLAPLVAHICADAAIAVILFFIVVLPSPM